MQKKYQSSSKNFSTDQQNSQQVEGEQVKKLYTKEDRIAEIEKCRKNIAMYETQTTREVKEAWHTILKFTIVGEKCPICEGRGHTLFQCASYKAIKGISNGMPIIKPVYNTLVAKEMLRLHEEALVKGNCVSAPDDNVMND